MNPLLIPFIQKLGSKIIDRVAGSKKARTTSTVGATSIAATVAFDPGQMLFPSNPEYAMILNAISYLVGVIFLAYKEKDKKE